MCIRSEYRTRFGREYTRQVLRRPSRANAAITVWRLLKATTTGSQIELGDITDITATTGTMIITEKVEEPEMTLTERGMSCCGISEINGINTMKGWTPLQFFKAFGKLSTAKTKHPNYDNTYGQAAYVLSYAYDSNKTSARSKGMCRTKKGCTDLTRLAKFIKENELGVLTIMKASPHPGYQGKHIIRAGMYIPHHRNLYFFLHDRKYLMKHEFADGTWRIT